MLILKWRRPGPAQRGSEEQNLRRPKRAVGLRSAKYSNVVTHVTQIWVHIILPELLCLREALDSIRQSSCKILPFLAMWLFNLFSCEDLLAACSRLSATSATGAHCLLFKCNMMQYQLLLCSSLVPKDCSKKTYFAMLRNCKFFVIFTARDFKSVSRLV